MEGVSYVGAVRTWDGTDRFYTNEERYFNAIGFKTTKIAVSCTNGSKDSLVRQLNREDTSI